MPLREKIDYAEYIQEKGAHYIGKGVSLESERMKHNSSECYIFFCSWSQSQGLADNKRYFNSLIEEKKFSCFLVDIESQPDMSQREGVDGGNRIYLFSNGEYILKDCFGEYLEDRKKCLVKCTQKRTKTTEKPNKRVDVDLICPRSSEGRYCLKDVNEWFCADCRERLQYDFEHNFLCDCGSAPINTFQFRCSDPKHGVNFIGFSDNKYLTDLVSRLRPYKEINILILGETGVGKSTWINGFANYLTFETLREAEEGRQIYLVPSKFTITDSNDMMKDIQVGKAENESFDVGASSTQKPKSYVFNVGKKTIRLIDTPGIGDCRGADQDALNFSSILLYIAFFSYIHGICILLKPNNSRMNIVFKPGDTLPILTKFLGDLKANRGVEISLSKGTTYYCMDNESFRFLCCVHEGEEFAEEEHKNFEQSWTLAVKETEILLNHFERDVTPHIVGQTVSLNETRRLILTLAKPLADISQIIQDNISEVNMKKDMITKLDARKIDLENALMISQIGFETNPLTYPRTVCTGTNCVDIQTLPNSNTTMTIYKTICHDHCYLDGIVPETCPNVDLQKCKAMDPSTSNCTECGCSWDVHIHIKFEQKKVKVTVEDPVTKQALQECHDSKEKQKIIIKGLGDRVEKYREEQKKIDEICAKFGAFLKENSIVPYNDTIEDYLKFNIGELKRRGNNTKSLETLQNVERLEKQLRQYKETKHLLKQNMESGAAKKVEATEIKKMQKELEQLELTGKQIKELFDATVSGQQTNFCYTEIYFDDSKHRKKNSNEIQHKSFFSKAKDWALGDNR
ncbi:hypothetical protein WR25_09422 [Diploscapter pachys]|uniref:G domain-containing protein n=1 Tax=Diploscapter pachys TaxID=2018661 RepID=A0A2A2KZL6_9BILA|nr:hypothetical protein WR25_09422 [Diploscapter pachys]